MIVVERAFVVTDMFAAAFASEVLIFKDGFLYDSHADRILKVILHFQRLSSAGLVLGAETSGDAQKGRSGRGG
jgi:hypothetical protein